MPDPVTDVYLELIDSVGLEASHLRNPDGSEVPNPKAGELAPLTQIRFQIPVPIMVDGELAMTTASAEVKPAPGLDPADPVQTRIIPGTRIVHTQAPAVVNVLLETGHYRHCDPPAGEEGRPHGGGGGTPRSKLKKSDLEEQAAANAGGEAADLAGANGEDGEATA